MDLRIPGGGYDGIDRFFGLDDLPAHQKDMAREVYHATEEDVVDSLAQLFQGNFEFVGLNDKVAWIQTADAGRGGYVLELSTDGTALHQYPVALSPEQVQAAFLAFLRGDPNCGLVWTIEAPLVATPRKRRWYHFK